MALRPGWNASKPFSLPLELSNRDSLLSWLEILDIYALRLVRISSSPYLARLLIAMLAQSSWDRVFLRLVYRLASARRRGSKWDAVR